MKLVVFMFSLTILYVNIIYYLYLKWRGSSGLMSHVYLIDLDAVKFQDYMVNFNKIYSDEEYHTRLRNFKASLAEIAKLNIIEGATVFGPTKFSDLSPQEFTQTMLKDDHICTNINASCTEYSDDTTKALSNYDIPETFDWRENGCKSPVLNQKLCAGCWAMAISGVMDCMAVKRRISPGRLSVQEFIDCSNTSSGCLGGSVSRTLQEFCIKNVNITTEEKYPLTLKENSVCMPQNNGVRLKEYRYQCLLPQTEILRQIANHGPLVTVINGAPLQNYIGGIIWRACVRNKDSPLHAIQIVGYDKTAPVPYYILKNSMGQDFGEDGYVKVAMEPLDGNLCGIREGIAYIDVH